jgi:hypothetical protein
MINMQVLCRVLLWSTSFLCSSGLRGSFRLVRNASASQVPKV